MQSKIIQTLSPNWGHLLSHENNISQCGDMYAATDTFHQPSKVIRDNISATLSSCYSYAFQTSDTALSDLTNPIALMAVLSVVLAIRRMKKILLPEFSCLGRRLAQSAHGRSWVSENEDRIMKFGEYIYHLCYHTSASIYGILYSRDAIWWDLKNGGTKHLWIGYPNHPVDPGMTWYYLVQFAYILDAFWTVLELSFSVEWMNPIDFFLGTMNKFTSNSENTIGGNWENRSKKKTISDEASRANPKSKKVLFWTPFVQIRWSPTIRGDFREMMFHHVVTIFLIVLSSQFSFTRIGSMVFLVHDVSDVPIDLSKLANFLRWEVTTIVCFAVMMLMWIVFRLIIFPFVIFRSFVVESFEYLVVQGTCDRPLYNRIYLCFSSLMASLILLHINWFFILMRIGWTLVTKGERHDFSEHKDGEKQ